MRAALVAVVRRSLHLFVSDTQIVSLVDKKYYSLLPWLFRGLLVVCLLWHAAPRAHADGPYGSSGSYGSYDDDDDDVEDELAFMAVLLGLGVGAGAAFIGLTAAAAPWWAPPRVLQDDYHIDGRFPHHPYENDHGGFLVLDNDFSQPHTPTGNLFIRGSVDGGTNFNDIHSTGIDLHLETRQRFGLDASWSTFNAKPGSSAIDDFQIGDANVIFRFAQSEHAQWWTGAGISWTDSPSADAEIGYNLTYGTDVCVGDPWVFSFQIDAGTTFHTQATIGAEWNGLEIYTGFDYVDIRDIGSVPSMIVGLRGWF